MDRPAQALQMISNFLTNSDYSFPALVDTTPKPIISSNSTPVATQNCTRKESDRIFSMPGLTDELSFKQYSGFLKGSDTHMLHYWLVEAELANPADAPLLLWLNGGPGSSSLEGLFFENGPFRIGKDGFTFANILYLESPVGVGYSYSTDGVLPQYSDELAKSWYGSTDAFHGFPCFNDDSMHTYLNRDDVKAAIHAQLVHKHDWSDCSNLNYHQQKKYYDMSEVIGGIMNSRSYTANKMRLMFYNGDVDTVCQFLGDQWLIESLAAVRNLTVISERKQWTYRQDVWFKPTIAGYVKQWSQNLVQLTVKVSTINTYRMHWMVV
ncbi:serine carboxypeptidase [Ancylostoma caninum]|uniref:Serine carboxypeptidase n=1 Tax=Ancylostoma caninum TaxID=29170 RepID=A0A368FVA3_ANCCA|nr:serine carboxypeptidase [Ancylostoma caninum]